MEYIAFVVILSLLVGYVICKVYSLVSEVRRDKEYIDVYQDVYGQKEGSYEKVCAYVNNTKDASYRNKGLILKLCSELDNELDCSETLNELSIRDVFLGKKGHFNKELFIRNSDVYLCLYLAMAKARKKSAFTVLNSLCEKINQIPESVESVEYQLAKAIYNALTEKEDRGLQFLNDLLEGNYTQYFYDKKLIGLYKKFGAATLAYNGELIDDTYLADLNSFAATGIGVNYLKSLDIYDQYQPVKEDKE